MQLLFTYVDIAQQCSCNAPLTIIIELSRHHRCAKTVSFELGRNLSISTRQEFEGDNQIYNQSM